MKKWNPRLLAIESMDAAKREMELVEVDPEGARIMAPKSLHYNIKVTNASIPAVQILKEEMLSKGGEAARARGSLVFEKDTSDVILMGTKRHYERLIKKLKVQHFGLKQLASELEVLLKRVHEAPEPLEIGGKPFEWGRRTFIMGVLNITPDSFSGDGTTDEKEIESRVRDIIANQPDIIDIGGESSRPGADRISADEEIRRIMPAIKGVKDQSDIPISVDTYKAPVAEAALKAGAGMINDISGLRFDRNMAKVATEYDACVSLMHIKGEPKNMQDNPEYSDLIGEISDYLVDSIEMALQAGINEERIILDPGIGFGKSFSHNLEILKRLKEFKSFGRPLLIGTSRKAFIGHYLGGLPPADRIEGTSATIATAIAGGADIVRVHDIREMRLVAKMTDAIVRGHQVVGEH